jgi:hypothetical protein
MAQPHVATVELSLYRGEDYVGQGTHKASGAYGAAAVDITGWTIVATLKAEEGDDAEVLLEVACTVVDGPTGSYQLPITASQSADLEAGTAADGVVPPVRYPLDIWRTNSGAKTVLAKGGLTIRQPIRTPS